MKSREVYAAEPITDPEIEGGRTQLDEEDQD